MTPASFIYASNFPTLTDPQIQAGIDATETMWAGALEFWGGLSEPLRSKKRTLLENLLVAWYLADLFPGLVTGVVANGALPLTSKSVGGVSVSFLPFEMQETLKPLLSNSFGIMAMQMIAGAGERFTVYG